MSSLFQASGRSRANPFDSQIQALIDSNDLPSAIEQTVHSIVTTVTDSARPTGAMQDFMDAFIVPVVTSPASHGPMLALLEALSSQAPTTPGKNILEPSHRKALRIYTRDDGQFHWSTLPGFDWFLGDIQRLLHIHRDDAPGSGTGNKSIRGDMYYLNFNIFCTTLLRVNQGVGYGMDPIYVLYMCKEGLERDNPRVLDVYVQPRLPMQTLRALDVRVAALWVREGASVLWNMDPEILRKNHAAALDEKTYWWPKDDGLTRQRWQLWMERLQFFSKDEYQMDEDTRSAALEAAGVIQKILAENQSS
ncbi:hypothetical protein S40293_10685 [Stachybotrys chartarum IBT 40293]|nr:hypothetical protein S40293_10685 [Stachybotrys chartarum IBT 40293]